MVVETNDTRPGGKAKTLADGDLAISLARRDQAWLFVGDGRGGEGMVDQSVAVELDEFGGRHVFKSWDQVLGWIDKERQEWGWLINGGFSDRAGMGPFFADRISWLWNMQHQSVAQGEALQTFMNHIYDFYRGGARILHSESDLGQRVLDIKEAVGKEAAAFAAAFALGKLQIGSAQTLPEHQGILLLALPEAIPAHAVAESLQKERKNLRGRADTLISQLQGEEERRATTFRSDRQWNRRLLKRFAARRFSTWQQGYSDARAQAEATQVRYVHLHETSKGELAAVHATYLEAMKLQAPVKYWKDKAEQHGKAERSARNRLLWYFPIAILLLGATFGFSSWWLLSHPQKDLPTALYVVVSGGLATVAGLAFWIGRILTKLYLSEHHLRHDAEERAVMTTTYLALTKERAAEDVDRQIVLTALFRSTPDGIVKDDGPPDMNLATILARLGAGGGFNR